jgi:hypothetical protein
MAAAHRVCRVRVGQIEHRLLVVRTIEIRFHDLDRRRFPRHRAHVRAIEERFPAGHHVSFR